MAIGLIGRKVGMTRIFTEDGTSIPVSVIEVLVNRVAQVKHLILTVIVLFKLQLVPKKPTASIKQMQVTLPRQALKPVVDCGKCV